MSGKVSSRYFLSLEGAREHGARGQFYDFLKGTFKRSYTINLKSERTKSISVDESEDNRLWNGCPSMSHTNMSHTLTHKEDPYVTHKEEEIACQRSLVANDSRLKCNNLKIQWNNLQ